MQDTTQLNKSKLGTKQYWDDFYAVERKNFKANEEDTGECWFDDNDAEQKMVDFLSDNIEQYSIESGSSMIDLGTGNGHLLFELAENDFAGPMLGVDYSEESVQFANEIAQSRGLSSTITFEQADIFSDDWSPGEFDIVLDKGTLDAIALSGLQIGNKSVVECYSTVVEKLLKDGGVFLITSCNFTQEELTKIIETDNLKVWETVDYPVFEFGGVKGTPICTIAFVKGVL
ncbi:Efm4p KNAG_0D01550 [Huiozyma naganishii CBS 8797]|uniref:Protein-lysine N-methyltransferase EFM4 n=1 Tax=Huiozyma naganishii (strain ATCC MYA-139 / BCRC 22969 / CBS 8797 / KCTC 17520 / NBRC 10181 / NCYC 3082 / Yp74L-3) TaxID=1071383 RepID=J7RXS6_HUIN7|nr:hypothetical protein KNAG_0D01550 [Kazachstania naganishii CBS 8797]CCK69907.1 hypothetical protein KNAG_0D01550 [Kazachstania naganishii CBS 8797]